MCLACVVCVLCVVYSVAGGRLPGSIVREKTAAKKKFGDEHLTVHLPKIGYRASEPPVTAETGSPDYPLTQELERLIQEGVTATMPPRESAAAPSTTPPGLESVPPGQPEHPDIEMPAQAVGDSAASTIPMQGLQPPSPANVTLPEQFVVHRHCPRAICFTQKITKTCIK